MKDANNFTVHEIKHPSNSFIHKGDFVSLDDILLVDENFRIFRNNKEIKIDFKLEWPIARIVSDDLFLLVDGESYDNQNNAWIIKNDGTIVRSFFLDRVTDIHIVNSKIIALYSKCSLDTSRFMIYSSKKDEEMKMKYLRGECFAVFDLRGNCLYKYMSDVKDEDFIFLMEVESALKIDDNSIYLLAFSAPISTFLILELNLNTFFLKKIFELEEDSIDYFPRSMTKKNDIWYFLMTDNYIKSHILKLNNDLSFQKIGECNYSHSSIGLIDGSFFVPLHFSLNGQEVNSCHVKIN